jgi:hypothetical protein
MPFSPISSLNSKNYPRNIKYMPPVIFRVCLDLREKLLFSDSLLGGCGDKGSKF